MTAPEIALNQKALPQMDWPEPLSAREWDQRFPGIFDTAAFIAGPANVILQLARMQIGYGVMESRVESGSVMKHPVKRSRTTFTYLAVAMLGTPEEKLAYRREVNRAHAQVNSTAQSPVKYNAFDPELQLWVAACIAWGFVDANSRMQGEYSAEKRAEFYRLAEPLATTLQVRPGMWPADLAAFEQYFEEGLAQVHIDDNVRAYLMRLVDLKILPPALRGLGRFHRFVTTGFLPPRLREEMHLDWDEARQKRFDRFLRVLGLVSRGIPRVVRQAPYLMLMWDVRRRMRRGLPMV